MKREPIQPSWQQNISRDGHWQCFWNSQYPIPSLLQSVARQVGRDFSKILTPSWILEQISFFEASNAFSVPREWGSKALNGNITDVMENAYATWLTRPNQARMSVMPCGVGNLEIDLRYFAEGLTSVKVIWNPANSTLSQAKRNLLGFRVMPLVAQRLSHSVAWWNASVMLEEGVIDALGVVGYVRYQGIVSSGVGITRCYLSLGCGAVPIPPPWR